MRQCVWSLDRTLLIQAGVDVTAKTESKETALISGAKWGTAATVEALIAARSEIEVRDSDGKTALIHAACDDDRVLMLVPQDAAHRRRDACDPQRYRAAAAIASQASSSSSVFGRSCEDTESASVTSLTFLS